MNVEVKLFAIARQAVGAEVVTVVLADHATVRDLRTALVERYPTLGATMRHMLVAVDTEYASDASPLHSKSEVALIPPVSGG